MRSGVPIPNPKVGMLVFDVDFPEDRWEVTAVGTADDHIEAKRITPADGIKTSWTWDEWDNAWFQGYLKEATA